MLTQNEYGKIVELVSALKYTELSWRTGQILFNAIYTINPDVANEIRTTNLDTFYTNDPEKIQACWDHLAKNVQ